MGCNWHLSVLANSSHPTGQSKGPSSRVRLSTQHIKSLLCQCGMLLCLRSSVRVQTQYQPTRNNLITRTLPGKHPAAGGGICSLAALLPQLTRRASTRCTARATRVQTVAGEHPSIHSVLESHVERLQGSGLARGEQSSTLVAASWSDVYEGLPERLLSSQLTNERPDGVGFTAGAGSMASERVDVVDVGELLATCEHAAWQAAQVITAPAA